MPDRWGVLVAVVGSALVVSHAGGQEPVRTPEDAAVIKLLPLGPDMMGPEMNDFLKLVAMGEKAYPALCRFLETTDDSLAISRALSVFARSDGDKADPRRAIRRLLARSRDKDTLLDAIRVLSRIGERADADILVNYLGHDHLFVRVNAARALAKLGDARTVGEAEALLESRLAHMDDEARAKDVSIEETRTAIEAMRRRPAALDEARTDAAPPLGEASERVRISRDASSGIAPGDTVRNAPTGAITGEDRSPVTEAHGTQEARWAALRWCVLVAAGLAVVATGAWLLLRRRRMRSAMASGSGAGETENTPDARGNEAAVEHEPDGEDDSHPSGKGPVALALGLLALVGLSFVCGMAVEGRRGRAARDEVGTNGKA
jgi:hypothetical protein